MAEQHYDENGQPYEQAYYQNSEYYDQSEYYDATAYDQTQYAYDQAGYDQYAYGTEYYDNTYTGENAYYAEEAPETGGAEEVAPQPEEVAPPEDYQPQEDPEEEKMEYDPAPAVVEKGHSRRKKRDKEVQDRIDRAVSFGQGVDNLRAEKESLKVAEQVLDSAEAMLEEAKSSLECALAERKAADEMVVLCKQRKDPPHRVFMATKAAKKAADAVSTVLEEKQRAEQRQAEALESFHACQQAVEDAGVSARPELIVEGMHLTELPENTVKIPSLTRIIAPKNRLFYLPPGSIEMEVLEELDLSFNRFKHIPVDIWCFTTLTSLNLSDNKIDEFSTKEGDLELMKRLGLWTLELNNLVCLEKFNLSYNRFREIPSNFGSLSNLRDLRLCGNRLEALPEELGELTTLTRLEFRSNKIRALPETFAQLTNLKVLQCGWNRLSALPALSDMENLKHLGVQHNAFVVLPTLEKLTALKTLELDYNKFASLPMTLTCLVNLRELNAGHNVLDELPEEFGALTALELLELHNNCLTAIPDSFIECKSLTTLDCSHNRLKRAPLLCALGELQDLDMSYNELEFAPELEGLEFLTDAILSHNAIETVHESFFPLPTLSTLDLSHNRIASLPEILCSHTMLTSLDVSFNAITAFPLKMAELSALSFLKADHNQLVRLPKGLLYLPHLQGVDVSCNNLNSRARSLLRAISKLPTVRFVALSENPFGGAVQSAEKELVAEERAQRCLATDKFEERSFEDALTQFQQHAVTFAKLNGRHSRKQQRIDSEIWKKWLSEEGGAVLGNFPVGSMAAEELADLCFHQAVAWRNMNPPQSENAKLLLNRALELGLNDPAVHFALGLTLLSTDEYLAATDSFSAAIDLFGVGKAKTDTLPTALMGRMICWTKLGDFPRCVRDCNLLVACLTGVTIREDEIVSSAPERRMSVTLMNTIASMSATKNLFIDTLDVSKNLRKVHAPSTLLSTIELKLTVIQVFKGIALYKQLEYEPAVHVFTEVLVEEPENCEALFYRGLAFKKLSQLQASLKDITQLLILQDDIVRKDGKIDAALRSDALLLRGSMRQSMGLKLKAALDFELSQKIDAAMEEERNAIECRDAAE